MAIASRSVSANATIQPRNTPPSTPVTKRKAGVITMGSPMFTSASIRRSGASVASRAPPATSNANRIIDPHQL
jgi:hypothetical protein